MNHDNSFLYVAKVIGIVLLGIIFFFAMIGVFGLGFAAAGLVLFVIAAIAVYRVYRTNGTEV
jgi:hypothetical protein